MMASGIFGQYVYVDITANVVIAKLSSLPDPLDLEVSADSLAAFAAVTERPRWRGRLTRQPLAQAASTPCASPLKNAVRTGAMTLGGTDESGPPWRETRRARPPD